MNAFWTALLIGLVDTLLGFVGVLTLKLRRKTFNTLVYILVSFAAGSLIGGAFFHLIPEAVERINPLWASVILILGFLTFLLLEQWLHWHKCGKETCPKKHAHSYTYLMVIGDFIHNIIDGLILIGSFLANATIGVVTAIMILVHELPEELGIFAVLVHGGVEEKKSIYYSVVAQSSVLIGIILGYFFLKNSQVFVSYLLPFAAGGFIYIGASDLIPEVNRETPNRFRSTAWIIIGLAFMLAVKLFFEH